MFRIEYLKLSGHPQLGTIDLFLSDKEEIHFTEKPYTSVIIGPNGTGKSFILRTLADIFTLFHSNTDKSKSVSLPFTFHLRYTYSGAIYEIVSRQFILLEKSKLKRGYLFLKNRPDEIDSTADFFKKAVDYEISRSELVFPENIIVSSVMLNDRFLFRKSDAEDFYQYMGARSTASAASTRSATKLLIDNIFKELKNNPQFLSNLRELLLFLNFEETLEVEYRTKVSKLFFSGSLTVGDFRRYYESWWEDDFKFSNRARNNPIWSKPYYDKFYKNDIQKIEQTVKFLNDLAVSEKLTRKTNARSKNLKIDFFSNNEDQDFIQTILQLERLDIVNINGIALRKNTSNLSVAEISSGEYHLIVSLIGIFSKIRNSSLVLIDEPEISLHPNWQMKYISFLKNVFKNQAGCHFILTSHSHFIISDLEGKSSNIIGLKRNQNKLELIPLPRNIDTFGWSAEEVLYRVFELRTNRNHYFEFDITELASLIQAKSKDTERLVRIITKLKKFEFSKNDPLTYLINMGERLVKQNYA